MLLTHSGNNGDDELLALVEVSLQRLANVRVRDLNVVLGGTVGVHEGEETVIDVEESVFSPGDVGNVHVVGGGGEILELLAGEDLYFDTILISTFPRQSVRTNWLLTSMATRWTLA